MRNLTLIKKNNLRLLQNQASHARKKIDEAYESQRKEIDQLIDTILEHAPRSNVLKENLLHITEQLFYKRPSKSVILFLKQLQGYPDAVISNCLNDFIMYMLDHKERRKPSVKLFNGYLKTALMSHTKKLQHVEKQDLGL